MVIQYHNNTILYYSRPVSKSQGLAPVRPGPSYGYLSFLARSKQLLQCLDRYCRPSNKELRLIASYHQQVTFTSPYRVVSDVHRMFGHFTMGSCPNAHLPQLPVGVHVYVLEYSDVEKSRPTSVLRHGSSRPLSHKAIVDT
jgi:hypothetical protein